MAVFWRVWLVLAVFSSCPSQGLVLSELPICKKKIINCPARGYSFAAAAAMGGVEINLTLRPADLFKEKRREKEEKIKNKKRAAALFFLLKIFKIL